MIELMVALLIGLFLLGALGVLAFENKRTFVGQNGLAQLQDEERLASTIMTDVIQTAGYYPSPQLYTAINQMPATTIPVTMVAGQSIAGQAGDSITVRYATNNADGILLCNGTDNQTGGLNYYGATFTVVANQLVCNMTSGNGAAVVYPLVNNVSSLVIYYGVNSGGTGNNVDTYMNAAQVTTAGLWTNVVSVMLTINFINPLTAAGGNNVPGVQAGQQANIPFTRTVALMNKAGI
jgi:type IV pilus assembly protein PilW